MREKIDKDSKLVAEPVEKKISIKMQNLVQMVKGTEDGQFYFVDGGLCPHSPLGWRAVSGLKVRMEWLDGIYKNTFGHRLSFNDASLMHGGRFDNGHSGGQYSLCHKSHRRGNDIDLNNQDEGGDKLKTTVFRNKPRLRFLTEVASHFGL